MANLFVTVYFNYCNYEKRYQLSREFIERYPWVQLIEVAYEDREFEFSDIEGVIQHREAEFTGWCSNKYFNQFAREHLDAKSITFIDSDCILEDDFRDKLDARLDLSEGPLFIQPFTHMRYTRDQYVSHAIPGSIYEKIVNNSLSAVSHTGLIYTYNNALLNQLLPVLLPEKLVLGSFDTALHFMLLGETDKLRWYYSLIGNPLIIRELEYFRKKLVDVEVGYTENVVLNCMHGAYSARQYNTRLMLYRNLSYEVILGYFQSRLENDSD